MAGEGAVGDAVDQVPLPRIHLGAGEGPGRGWGLPVPGASCPSSAPPPPTGLDRQRWEGARTRQGGRRRPRLDSSAFVAAAPGLPGSLTAAAAAP